MTFDVTDKQYQLKDDIKPDKESTWKHPKEKDGKQRDLDCWQSIRRDHVGSFSVVVELSRVSSGRA
jgi:hypothetical protein